jgi:tRNA pseudouridine55 synthase
VLRDLQKHFNPSELFAPWISVEKSARARENHNQRRRRREKTVQVKIGHGGTLDPLATGVLICGVGKGTKSLQDFLLCTKVYETVVLFGTSTDTYDRVGKVLRRAPYDHITKEAVEEALGQFRGKFMQLPPLFSALKMNGKPLYEYAREGKEIPREIERRPVEVLNLELVEWMEGGTHSHEAPTDEAGYAEINVANKLWKQEGAQPASITEPAVKSANSEGAEANFEALKEDQKAPIKDEAEGIPAEAVQTEELVEKTFEVKKKVEKTFEVKKKVEQNKRKMSEDQDDLVHESPAFKHRKSANTSEDATMSGGLPVPSTPAADTTMKEEPSSSPAKVKGPPAAKLRMTVTSGFYVRSLCHDLGTAVGSAALMAELERTRQGEFELGRNVLTYGDLEKGEETWGPKVEGFLDEWHHAHVRNPSKRELEKKVEEPEKKVEEPDENVKGPEKTVEEPDKKLEVSAAEDIVVKEEVTGLDAAAAHSDGEKGKAEEVVAV